MTSYIKNLWFPLLMFQHLLADAVSVFVVLTVIKAPEISTPNLVKLIVLYNFMAFATQFIFGYIADRTNSHKHVLLFSILPALLALFLMGNVSFLPIFLIGLSNSLFHVGGGSIVLRNYRNKAFYQGLFVAPGAIGLFLGTKILGNPYTTWVLFALLVLSFLYNRKFVNMDKIQLGAEKNKSLILPLVIVALLLTVVGLRALVGVSVYLPWKSVGIYPLLLMLAAAIGKSSGGWIADKKGYLLTGVATLMASAPLLLLSRGNPTFGIIGLVLFQMTMPITLTAINSLFKNREGVSFGLTTLMLFIGALPLYMNRILFYSQSSVIFLITIESSVLVFIAFTIYKNFLKTKYGDNINL